MLENDTSNIELVKENGIKLSKNKFSFIKKQQQQTNTPYHEDGSSCGAYVYAKNLFAHLNF